MRTGAVRRELLDIEFTCPFQILIDMFDADACNSIEQIAGIRILNLGDAVHVVNCFYEASVMHKPDLVAEIGNGSEIVGNKDVT